jgi:hypothetical protein
MGISTQTMTDEQRKSVILAYFKRLDSGRDFFELFDDDALLYIPKWGLVKGIDQVRQCFTEAGSTLEAIEHHYAQFNYVFSGSDVVVVEGTSHGRHRDGPWRAGMPEWGAGRWCDVFEICDFKIQRLFIYLDPDYANRDTGRYPWLANRSDIAAV